MRALLVLPLTLTLTLAAAEGHLLTQPERRRAVEVRFIRTRLLARQRDAQLFGVMAKGLTVPEREALQYLYAYMPLGDLADQEGGRFLRAVRATLEARARMPWGSKVPEDLFLSYVLPLRVNTEDLDEARPVLWAALRERVKGLTMEAAALEVNHWCQERVTYQPSDVRTSGPLATLRTTWGRCGEESTVLVAALRAVGLPARQVYTPRWAHVDDNHAWVEVWVDGKWRYMGACEPEPKLDMAWFREPSRRAMMVHCKVFGGSSSTDFKVRSTPWFDEIQVLPTYAPMVERRVRVVDFAGKPVEGATVEFGVFNYSEFFPLASPTTGRLGMASLPTGKGDLRIWARKGTWVGSALLPANAPEVTVRLAPFAPQEKVEVLDVHPPLEPWPQPSLAERAARQQNLARVAEGNRQREAILATFLSKSRALALAQELGVEGEVLGRVLPASQGNHAEILRFLRETPGPRRGLALDLLNLVSAKDLRDTPAEVLRDHLEGALAVGADLARRDPEAFKAWVLCPRIHHEMLTPWRSGLRKVLPAQLLGDLQKEPARAVAWLRTRLRIDANANWYGVPMRPLGTLELGVADERGRDMLLVALLRTAGVPARLEPGTHVPQFQVQGVWRTVHWTGQAPAEVPSGLVKLSGNPEVTPVYPVHFALSRFREGRFETLDFEDRPWASFQQGLQLPAGSYCLTTTTREDDGSVRARLQYFDLKVGSTRDLPLVFQPSQAPARVLGRVELGQLAFKGLVEGAPVELAVPVAPGRKAPTCVVQGPEVDLARTTGGKGLVLAWVGLGDEPTNHLLADLERLRPVFEKWGGGLALVLPQVPEPGARILDRVKDLANQSRLVLDEGGQLRKRVLEGLGKGPGGPLPCILGISRTGEVVYLSEGYRIGAGEQVLKAIRKLDR